MDQRLPEWLATRLFLPLPGPMVGTRFEPLPRLGRRYDQPPPEARRAAVLILLYPHANRWHLPLIVRPASLSLHAGQIGLPGGEVEPGEGSFHAALREFHEELGGTSCPIQLLGALSAIYVTASNFRIEPWVGAATFRPAMTPSPAEVQRLLEVPLAHLLDPAHFGSHPRHYQGQPYVAPHFRWQEHQIWGATCMILGELVTVLQDFPSEKRASR